MAEPDNKLVAVPALPVVLTLMVLGRDNVAAVVMAVPEDPLTRI